MKKATPTLLLAGLALATCLQAQAAEPQAAAGADNAAMVGIDARTHKLRPLTASEARSLAIRAAAMPRSPGSTFSTVPRTAAEVSATVRRHGNGGTSARAPLSAMSQVSVTRGTDGQLQVSEGTPGESAPAPRQEVSE